jgi:hypothetical protein
VDHDLYIDGSGDVDADAVAVTAGENGSADVSVLVEMVAASRKRSAPGNSSAGGRVLECMELELTDAAAALLSKRGGTLVIDLIRPTG